MVMLLWYQVPPSPINSDYLHLMLNKLYSLTQTFILALTLVLYLYFLYSYLVNMYHVYNLFYASEALE